MSEMVVLSHVICRIIHLLLITSVQTILAADTRTTIAACTQLIRDAEKNFYLNHVYITCNDMLLMKHGGSIHYKCDIVRTYLKQHDALQCMQHCSSTPKRFPRDFIRKVISGCAEPTVSCDANAKYRTFDGSCNNLHHPTWGQSDRAQNRIVKNDYDDNLGSPRTLGCQGHTLPGARLVSLKAHRPPEKQKFEKYRSYMMMQVGQFLAHDFILTQMFTRDDGDPLLCCTGDASNAGCDPIAIPGNDPVFPPGGCMNFARSLSRNDCNNVQQQINSQTSYLDLSMMYGATLSEANGLRSFTGGKLLSQHYKLPPDYDDSSCELDSDFNEEYMYCTKAGDPRVNEQPGLTAIHTVFMNEHNRIAEALAGVNPHWDDERLFNEARKILIAIWQNIVYTEYLPMVLGPHVMRKYGLNVKTCGYKDTYSEHTDATVINAVGSSVFRFGHSLVHREISMVSPDYRTMLYPDKLSKHFFKVNLYHAANNEGHQHILRWTTQQRCPMMDRHVEKSVHEELFQDINNEAFDLAALNIHRSRDHGNPGYNAYRAYCKLSTAHHFGTSKGGLVDHDPDVAATLANTYSCTDDIDLFTGVLTERRSPKSMLGPLGQCLIAIQFKRFRDGDRFFFERNDTMLGFTVAQLKTIKKTRLSSIICENSSTMQIQRNVFIRPLYKSLYKQYSLVDCHRIPSIDIGLWRETP